MTRQVLSVMLLASAAAFCGCAPQPHRQTGEYGIELTLYQTNQAPLATLQLLLPKAASTSWSTGQWRGELSPTYVRPEKSILFASDLLKASSWRPLRCRVDRDDPRLIHINLQPEKPTDNIRVWVPLRRRSSLGSRWYHWTDAGGFEGGSVRILQR